MRYGGGGGKDLTYPEVIITCPPYVCSIPDTIREQSWSEISGKIDGIPSLPTQTSTDAKDQKE